jgi:hypothetical protein
VYKFVLAINMLIWLFLAFRQVMKPQSAEFHPAGYYIAFHGVALTILPIIILPFDLEFISQLYKFELSENEKIVLILGSLALAAALRWAQEHGYNLTHDSWMFVMFLQLSFLLVFIVAYLFPIYVGAYFESIRTKPFWT